MKYVIMADFHFMLKGYSRSINGIPEHIYYPMVNMELGINKAKELDCPFVIAGDIIDDNEKISQIVYDYVYDSLQNAIENVETFIVIGNHDYFEQNGKRYSFLKKINTEIIESGNPLSTRDISLIGHNYDHNKIKEDFSNIDFESSKLIVSHFGLKEGLAGNSSYKGGEFSIKDFKEMKDKMLILGHYHKPQKVAENIYYVGSPNPIRIDEREDNKRFMVVDTDNMEIESIETIYPKIKTIKVTDDMDIKTDDIASDIENNLTTFVFEIDKQNIESKMKLMELKNEYIGHIVVKDTNTKNDNEDTPDEQKSINISSISIQSVSDEFLDKVGVDRKEHDLFKKEVENLI